MKKTIAALMSLTAACAMLTPAFAAGTESPAPISQPPAVISEAPGETTGRCTFEINGKDVPVDAVIIVPLELFDALLGSKVGTIALDDNKIKINTEGTGSVEIPNPFVECGTLAEAGEVAGFELRAPESVGDYDRASISAMDGELIEVLYKSGDDTVSIRKAPGADDISGDYNSYAETDVSEVDGMEVTMKGDAGRVHPAVWTSGEYTYSVSASAGMSRGEMTALIREIA